MSPHSSLRSNSAILAQNIEIAQLKQQNMQLQQECNAWEGKHREAKHEAAKAHGQSASRTRRIHLLEKQCADFQSQIITKDHEIRRLKAQPKFKTKATSVSDRSATAELQSVRSQLKDLQQEFSELQVAHKAHDDCAAFRAFLNSQVVDQRELKEAALAACEAYGNIMEANALLEQEALTAQHLIEESARDLRTSDAKIKSLETDVQIHRADAHAARDKANALRNELLTWKHRKNHPQFDMQGVLTNVSVPDGRPVTADSRVPLGEISRVGSGAEFKSNTGIAANITIHVDKSQRKNWKFLKRVQGVIANGAGLDIFGPQDLVADLVSAMHQSDIDHKEKTAAAAHWQKVANNALAEVDNMRTKVPSGPTCTVSGHKNLVDELEAKDLQLLIQAQLVAKWEKQMSGFNHAFNKATDDLRKEGVRGL